METNTSTWSEYTLPISTDPSYYGSTCAAEDAERIVERLSAMVREQFPGITVERYSDIGPAGVRGPDDDRCDEIRRWVESNWTSAL